MSDDQPPMDEARLIETLAKLEHRLTRLENFLSLPPLTPAASSAAEPSPSPTDAPEEELEYVVGQNWFAGAGIVALTCGVAFALSLPFPRLPAIFPALAGYFLAGGLFLFAHLGRKSFELAALCLRGASMALLYFSTLRLFFFGAEPVLGIDSIFGRMVLLATVTLIFALAQRSGSRALLILALFTGYVTAVVPNSPLWLFVGLIFLSALIGYTSLKRTAPLLLLLAIVGTYLSHFLWVIGNPWAGRPLLVTVTPAFSVYFILIYAAILGLGSLLRIDRSQEDQPAILTAVFNSAGGYGLFFLHSFMAFSAQFVAANFAAAIIFLGLAIVFRVRTESRASVFFYAMTGYMALSMSILKAFSAPEVFIWLSLQSLLVVATALWFRSRFIVVANFIIFVAIVLSYMFTVGHETGISLGFGVVALLTARILNWQRERLELKTGLMRNAYLACAFVVFPYALYHLVPHVYVSVSWVGVAVIYYLMNLVVQNVKYRWMGHLTLLLTVLYVLFIGVAQLAPGYRIFTLLVLGSVLLAVSLSFTRLRARWRAGRSSD